MSLNNEFLFRTFGTFNPQNGVRTEVSSGFTLNSYLSNSVGYKIGKFELSLDIGIGNFYQRQGSYGYHTFNRYHGLSARYRFTRKS